MTKFKITQDHEACISCGNCVAACPENWEMGSDGKANPKKSVDTLETNKDAAAACPVGCITVEETSA